MTTSDYQKFKKSEMVKYEVNFSVLPEWKQKIYQCLRSEPHFIISCETDDFFENV